MANAVYDNIIKRDTASADLIFSATERVRVLAFRWVGATTAGHTVSVQDSDGNVLWDSVATAANFKDEQSYSDDGLDLRKGLKVPTIGSGILYIHLA